MRASSELVLRVRAGLLVFSPEEAAIISSRLSILGIARKCRLVKKGMGSVTAQGFVEKIT